MSGKQFYDREIRFLYLCLWLLLNQFKIYSCKVHEKKLSSCEFFVRILFLNLVKFLELHKHND